MQDKGKTPFGDSVSSQWDETAQGLGSLLAPQLGSAGRIAGGRVVWSRSARIVGLTGLV